MKTYYFTAHNWKSGTGRPFRFTKQFDSIYAADRWASRITFSRASQYVLILEYGKEHTA